MTFETLLLAATTLYLIQTGIFLWGVRRSGYPQQNAAQPLVSIVIAARNEERNLRDCLTSVLNQTYPSDRFEVIVANDGSTDGTDLICDDFRNRYSNFSWFTTLPDQRLRGKTNALAQAIDKAQGEIILITDADCVVPHTWVEETTRYYTPELGIMGGITLQEASRPFHGMQSLDWAYLLGVASAAVQLHTPLSTIGNNLSFRKEAYEAVGGYRKIPFSVTEDYTLFQTIINSGKWQYAYPINERLLVMSKPCQTLRDLIRQKHRWGKGGLDMKVAGFLIMAVSYTLHGSLLVGLSGLAFLSASIAFIVKSCADYLFVHRVLAPLRRTDLLRYFWYFQLYFILYVLFLPFLVAFGGKVVWKGRKY